MTSPVGVLIHDSRRITLHHPLCGTISRVLRTLPHLTATSAHAAILGPPVFLASWNVPEWRPFIQITEISAPRLLIPCATYLKGLPKTKAPLNPLIHNVSRSPALRARSWLAILVNRGYANVPCLQVFRYQTRKLRTLRSMHDFHATTMARPIQAARVMYPLVNDYVLAVQA